MPIPAIPKFTRPAAKLWETIPNDTREVLLANVWCGRCRHDVAITSYSGRIQSGSLLLIGKCSDCAGGVTRLIEFEIHKDETHIVLGPPRLTDAEADREFDLLGCELTLLMKRVKALMRKSANGTSTNKEEAELSRLLKKDSNAMLIRRFGITRRGRRANVRVK